MVTNRSDPPRPRRADVADGYDRGAAAYEALWSPVILPPAAVLVRLFGLTGRCVIADVGAGTGALLSAIRSAAPDARVVALGTSAEMLHIARTRRGASAVLADALALPLADGVADAIILAYVLFHLADPSVALTEAGRVLRADGQVATVTWAWERPARADSVWDDTLTEAGVPPGPLRRVDTGLCQTGTVKALLRAAGPTAQARLDRAAPASMGPVIVLGPGHRLGLEPRPAQPRRRHGPGRCAGSRPHPPRTSGAPGLPVGRRGHLRHGHQGHHLQLKSRILRRWNV